MEKITRTIKTAEKTPGGLIVPVTKTEIKEPFYVKEGGSGVSIVVSSSGKEERVYSDKLHGKDYKKLAEGYAKKLSKRFR